MNANSAETLVMVTRFRTGKCWQGAQTSYPQNFGKMMNGSGIPPFQRNICGGLN
jgi:hypothetical protein